MNPFEFLKSWPRDERVIFWLAFGLVLAALGVFWQGWLVYPGPVITLEHFQQVQPVETITHTFSVGLVNLGVPADSSLIIESIFGSRLHPNLWASVVFLVALSGSFLLVLTVISTLSRFWFLIGMGSVMLLLTSLRLDALQVFGLGNKTTTIAVLLLLGGLSYYLHAIRRDLSLGRRLIFFSILILVVGLVFGFFSRTTAPLYHVAVNGLVAGMVVTVVFVLMVAHEIIAGIVTLTTQRAGRSRNLIQFLILSGGYLVNLALMFASKIGYIQWEFFALNSFFVFTLSVVLGWWGFRQRIALYDHILPSAATGLLFYGALALTAVATMGYFAATAGDMMLDVFDDVILAAHLGGGIIFVFYVIANFGPMLMKNLPVYKVLYKPETMPHFTYRIMLVIATFAVISMASYWKTYINQSTAAYYNAYGDLYRALGDDALAEADYLRSVQFRNQNLHAHYALASIYGERVDTFKEKAEYNEMRDWSPAVPVFLNMAETDARSGNILTAALTIDEGKKKFPKSGALQNAAGLAFLKLKSADSAFYFFQQAARLPGTAQAANTNLTAAAALFLSPVAPDSLIAVEEGKDQGKPANTMALANTQGRRLKATGQWSHDTALSVYQAALLANFLINQNANADTAIINQATRLAHISANGQFKDMLLTSAAHARYARGDVKTAMDVLREVNFTGATAKTLSLMGLWLLEQNNPLMATTYFRLAAEKQHPYALYHLALASTASDSLTQAYFYWDSLSHTKSKELATVADLIKKTLTATPAEALTLSDEGKYYYCGHKIALQDSAAFLKIINSMSDPNMQARARLDRAQRWFVLDETDAALYQLRQISTVSVKLKKPLEQLALMVAADKRNYSFITEQLGKGVDITLNQRQYLEAVLAEGNGRLEEAHDKYLALAQSNNQFDEGLAAASRFFLAHDTTERLQKFSLLVDGLLAKPNSVKILKQHVLGAMALGLPEPAQESLDKLRGLLPDKSFRKFIAAHPEYFKAVTK